mgnify:CR=1 FL=1
MEPQVGFVGILNLAFDEADLTKIQLQDILDVEGDTKKK